MTNETHARSRFHVSDMMSLIAATAPGLVLLRFADEMKLFTNHPHIAWDIQFLEYLSVATGCVFVPMAFAVLAIGLFDRRAARAETIQGTGFVCCLAVAAATVYALAYLAVRIATTVDLDLALEKSIQFNNFFGRVKFLAGPMILGVWLAMILTGRFRSPTWNDRLGVIVGLGVVLPFLFHELYHFMQPIVLSMN